ncbi:MAG: hypothetical protein QM796_01410 [Chthoniobacteraceae bacterium]
MKTTIDFPEELLHRAKIVAAQRKTTLKELVLQGLDYAITHPARDAAAERKVAFKELLQRMQASNTEPMAPLKRDEIYER